MSLLETKPAIKLTRSFEVGVRLAPEERVALELSAAETGQTLSGYIRSRGLAGHICIVQTVAKASPSLLIQLRRIVTNLDQIADELSRREGITPKGIADTANEINEFVIEQILVDASTRDMIGSVNAPRSTQINVRFTGPEHVHLKCQAEKADCSLSAFLRAQAQHGSVTVRQPAQDFSPKVTQNIRDLGLYLNRMAHRLNAGGDIPSELDHICLLIRRTFQEEFSHGASRGKSR